MSDQMIAGPYDLYWAESGQSVAASLGASGPTGITYIEQPNINWITGDVLGPETIVDGVYQGKNATIAFQLQEIKLSVAKKFLHPFGVTSSLGADNPELFGVPGTIISVSYQGRLELIPRANTPAASLHAAGGNGRRFFGVFAGELRENLDTRPRFVPVVFRCMPFVDTADSNKLKIYKRITTINE